MKFLFNKVLLSLVLNISTLSLFAQVNISEIDLSNHPLTDKKIVAKAYQFDENIFSFHIDSITEAAVMQLRKLSKRKKKPSDVGTLAYLSLRDESVIWDKPVDFQADNIYCVANNIYKERFRDHRTFILDSKTGRANRELKHLFYHINEDNIGFGFSKVATEAEDVMQAVDLNTYEVLWEREIDRSFDLSEFKSLNDSTLLISGGGIRSININDGRGWAEFAVTGEQRKDFSKYSNAAIAFGAIGVAIASAVDDREDDMVTYLNQVESKILVDESGIYYASRDFVIKKDPLIGRTLWKTEIPEGYGSQSSIYKKDSVLYVVHQGKALRGTREIDYGKPSVFGYHAETGDELFFENVPLEDGRRFSDVYFGENMFYAISAHFISSFSYADCKLQDNVIFSYPREIATVKFFQDDDFAMSKDSVFTNPTAESNGLVHLKDGGKRVRVDIEQTAKSIHFYENWKLLNKINNLSIIARENHLIVLNKEYKKLAEFTSSSGHQLVENKLYFSHGNTLLAIDLDQFD